MSPTWHIYHIEKVSRTKPKPKDKFVAIVCRDSKPRGFFVNTNINSYIQNRQYLLVCQVLIKASYYRFLNYDSYINCGQLCKFKDSDLTGKKWAINKQTKAEIQRVVSNTKTIEPHYRELILGS
jgi:hypothetical protein